MSLKASTSQHIYFEDSFGSLTAFLECLQGDVLQTYADPMDWEHDTNYIPQYSPENHRIIEMFLNATGASSEDLRVTQPQWTYNGADCTQGDAANYFETILLNNRRAQLKVKGNVGKLSHNQNIVIKCRARVGTEGSLTTIPVEADTTIKLRQQTQDTYRCTIAALNEKSNYTIGANGEAVGLKCIVYDWMGREVEDPNLTYAWTKRTTADHELVWEPIGDGSQQIQVGPDQVDNQATIKVDVKLNGTLICNDQQTVYDLHDPVQIKLTLDPSDNTIRRNGADVNVINVYADCVRSDGTRCSRANLTFVLLDTTGNEVQVVAGRKWQDIEWVKSDKQNGQILPTDVAFTITVDDFRNGGRELILYCEGDVEY